MESPRRPCAGSRRLPGGLTPPPAVWHVAMCDDSPPDSGEVGERIPRAEPRRSDLQGVALAHRAQAGSRHRPVSFGLAKLGHTPGASPPSPEPRSGKGHPASWAAFSRPWWPRPQSAPSSAGLMSAFHGLRPEQPPPLRSWAWASPPAAPVTAPLSEARATQVTLALLLCLWGHALAFLSLFLLWGQRLGSLATWGPREGRRGLAWPHLGFVARPAQALGGHSAAHMLPSGFGGQSRPVGDRQPQPSSGSSDSRSRRDRGGRLSARHCLPFTVSVGHPLCPRRLTTPPG